MSVYVLEGVVGRERCVEGRVLGTLFFDLSLTSWVSLSGRVCGNGYCGLEEKKGVCMCYKTRGLVVESEYVSLR